MSWNDINKKTKKQDRCLIVIIVLILLYGFVDEIITSKGCGFIVVQNLETVSLSALQIQATVFTLTISILALIAGLKDEIFLGISVSDYLLNIRPGFFKHNRIFTWLLVSIVVSAFLVLFGCYNMQMSIFVASCLVVWIDVKHIIRIFLHHYDVRDEMMSYVEFIFKKE